MVGKDSPQNLIDNYRKRQQRMPYLIGGLAVLLVIVGIIILIVWFAGGKGGAKFSLFATKTPTPTQTSTATPVTPTATFTITPTETLTLAATVTVTPNGPFEYTVKEGDSCWQIAKTFNVDADVLLAINNFAPGKCPIVPGQKILVPAPGQTLPTETPLPTNIARGTKINYVVKTGDTLASIASRFNSTVEAIMLLNKITDANKLVAGQTLIIQVNLVTPTTTLAPTSTSRPGSATTAVPAGGLPTITRTP
jgi:LysM repeat protein